ncbi:fimbrial biogenesis chaperone [Proteus vulgaris]|uniref:fimbrial biogenesis chaperone n=2 Tax=Gammaproteobacteria TaxID=1236 RepID=UPI00098BCFF9
MMKSISLFLSMLVIATFHSLSFADDGIVLSTTRVILDKDSKTIQMTNNSSRPYLIKSDLLESPDNLKKNNTVMITPPLFKLAAHESRPIKLYKKNNADESVESLGYLAVLAIPALDKDAVENKNTVAIGLRNIIKVFIRPAALADKKKDNDCLIDISHNGKAMILKNTTPYFITLVAVTLNNDAQNILPNTIMLSPLAQGTFIYPKALPPNTQIHWQTINDYGFASEWCRSTLQHPPIK